VLDLLAALERFYGPLPTPPNDPFRAYVWEALSTQTPPSRRDAAFAALQRIPALTPDSMFRAPRAVLTAAVALSGAYADQRLHALLAGVERFRREPRLPQRITGPLRGARRAVASLPRLGDGSLHRLLLFGGDHCLVPLDRDLVRLGRRLGLASLPEGGRGAGHVTHPRHVRRGIEEELPRFHETYTRAALYLRHHAVQTCTDEPHCGVCPIATRCPAARGDRDRGNADVRFRKAD